MNEDPPMGEMAVRIRRASPRDLPALARDPHSTGLLRDRLRRQFDGRGLLLVAQVGTVLAGRIYVWTERAQERELRQYLPHVPLLMNLWVPDTMRRRGIGTALIQEAEDRLWARGYRRVALGVEPDNNDAMRLYLKLLYDPWPYTDIKTRCHEYTPEGRLAGYHKEVCAVLVKELAKQRLGADRPAGTATGSSRPGPDPQMVRNETLEWASSAT